MERVGYDPGGYRSVGDPADSAAPGDPGNDHREQGRKVPSAHREGCLQLRLHQAHRGDKARGDGGFLRGHGGRIRGGARRNEARK